jgi:hypothetical protein
MSLKGSFSGSRILFLVESTPQPGFVPQQLRVGFFPGRGLPTPAGLAVAAPLKASKSHEFCFRYYINFSSDSVFRGFSAKSSAHKSAQMCIASHRDLENLPKAGVTICYLGRMLTREIQLDTEGAPVTLNPRWLRIPAAVKYSGLSRSRLYELLSEGRIRSICVKSQKWAQRGVRLIDRESIDLFMERQEFA